MEAFPPDKRVPAENASQKKKISRREMFVRALRSVESLAFTSVFPVHIVREIRKDLRNIVYTADVGYEEGKKFRLTDSVHTHAFGPGSIRNLGVFHSAWFFRQFEGHITDTIRACDILLLEGGERGSEKYDDFFPACRELAFAHEKRVFDIDYVRNELLSFQMSNAAPIATITGMAMAIQDTPDDPPKKPISFFDGRRNMLRAAGLAAVGSLYMLDFDNGSRSKEGGYIERGRSAEMMDNILAVAQWFPDQRIAVITGDAHAQLFEEYFKHPDVLSNDRKSYAIHNAVYSKGMHEIPKDPKAE